jgi:RimJ/RimL family protein N-acetyltransferase
MKIARTHDMELVRAILSHPAIWPHISDDSVTEPSPVDLDGIFWLLVDDGAPAGVFLLHAHNSACYEVHTCLLPRLWGAQAAQATMLCREWMFENTPCQKLVTNVPADNLLALRFAKRCGMTQEGVNRKSFLKQGRLLDQHVLGLTKEEWLCPQQSQR